MANTPAGKAAGFVVVDAEANLSSKRGASGRPLPSGKDNRDADGYSGGSCSGSAVTSGAVDSATEGAM
jgi:hypothetical protein